MHSALNLINSEIGKNFETIIDTVLASDKPWEIDKVENALANAPIQEKERKALERKIEAGRKALFEQLYAQYMTEYMLNGGELRDVGLDAQSLGQRRFDREEDKRRAALPKPAPTTNSILAAIKKQEMYELMMKHQAEQAKQLYTQQAAKQALKYESQQEYFGYGAGKLGS